MNRRKALVTGIAGQDGGYMAQLLLEQGYEVVGAGRRVCIAELGEGVKPVACDITDAGAVRDLVRAHQPDEIYNFAAMSSGAGMFDDPAHIGVVNGLAVTHLLEAIRHEKPSARLCQASSSEMFGEVRTSPQSELTEFKPRSPYGAAKVYAHTMLRIYRERYGIFACSAILFNHESPKRRPEFVTRKVTLAAASIKLGLASEVALGNLDARRDWSSAEDVVRAMWMMLCHSTPDDYVVATGVVHSVRELCEIAFRHVGLNYLEFVRQAPDTSRSHEQVQLVGDARRARETLGWAPRVDFETLITSMVDEDMRRLRETERRTEVR